MHTERARKRDANAFVSKILVFLRYIALMWQCLETDDYLLLYKYNNWLIFFDYIFNTYHSICNILICKTLSAVTIYICSWYIIHLSLYSQGTQLQKYIINDSKRIDNSKMYAICSLMTNLCMLNQMMTTNYAFQKLCKF